MPPLEKHLPTREAAKDVVNGYRGTHREEVHLTTEDFRKPAHPQAIALACEAAAAHGW